MSPLHFAVAFIATAAFAAPALGQQDAIGIPGPIAFEDATFELAWTSNPSPTYYKQEYLPTGQTVEHYDQMFIIDVMSEGATPKTAAGAMVAGLEKRKPNDPMTNYNLISNAATGEFIIDFLLSDASRGELVVEWNAYRYVPYGDGVALFAISRRGYGDDATGFIGGLSDWRGKSIQALATMELPTPVLD